MNGTEYKLQLHGAAYDSEMIPHVFFRRYSDSDDRGGEVVVHGWDVEHSCERVRGGRATMHCSAFPLWKLPSTNSIEGRRL